MFQCLPGSLYVKCVCKKPYDYHIINSIFIQQTHFFVIWAPWCTLRCSIFYNLRHTNWNLAYYVVRIVCKLECSKESYWDSHDITCISPTEKWTFQKLAFWASSFKITVGRLWCIISHESLKDKLSSCSSYKSSSPPSAESAGYIFDWGLSLCDLPRKNWIWKDKSDRKHADKCNIQWGINIWNTFLI